MDRLSTKFKDIPRRLSLYNMINHNIANWKLSIVDRQERSIWRLGMGSAMCASSLLKNIFVCRAGRAPTHQFQFG